MEITPVTQLNRQNNGDIYFNEGQQQTAPDLELPSENKIYKKNPFIEANTKSVSLTHLKEDCVIPVFSKDNEITISHSQFIETALASVSNILGTSLSKPDIRISHQIKGRTPDALQLPISELQDHQKTTYYERMAWIARVPSITSNIGGNDLELTIGGVRAYNQENLYSKKSPEKFKFFIGFQNMVCCNLCISTDGFSSEMKADNVEVLNSNIIELVEGYNINQQLTYMTKFEKQRMSESQFAKLIGRAKLFQYLPKAERAKLPELLLTDGHMNTIAKNFYEDESFCRNKDGDISMWNVFNLFTGANKSSYIDTFLERNANAFDFSKGLANAINGDSNYRWFLS
ncbi:MAG: DUF3871 family protein [Aequorivita antarctica]